MELRHLLAFVAVAEEGTFSRAARRLNITQPPLSRQIRQLERELGGPLFLRGRGGAALTPEGRRLLNRARPVLESFRDIQQFGRDSQSKPRALQIGVGCGLWEALERIRALHATRFPGARVAAQDLCPAQQPADRQGADLIITRERPELFVFECEVLFEEQFVALISDRHRLAPRESVTLADLASEPLLLFERSCEPGTWDATVELIRRSSPRPRIIEGQPPPCTVAAMATIASGDGYYLSTASPFTQTHQAAGIAAVPLREPRGGVKVRLAWRADAPEDVKEFAEAARTAFRVGEHRGTEDE